MMGMALGKILGIASPPYPCVDIAPPGHRPTWTPSRPFRLGYISSWVRLLSSNLLEAVARPGTEATDRRSRIRLQEAANAISPEGPLRIILCNMATLLIDGPI